MIVNLDVMAIIGALVAGLVTFSIAGGLGGRLDSMRLILAGVTVGAFSFAFVRFTFTLEDNLSRMILTWTSADISSATFGQAMPLVLWAAGGLLAGLFMAHSFNLLALGDGASQGLGVDPRRMRFMGALLAAALTGASVAAAGLVLFADVVSKLVRFPYETPLGVICALIGAPYFLFATLRARSMA